MISQDGSHVALNIKKDQKLSKLQDSIEAVAQGSRLFQESDMIWSKLRKSFFNLNFFKSLAFLTVLKVFIGFPFCPHRNQCLKAKSNFLLQLFFKP